MSTIGLIAGLLTIHCKLLCGFFNVRMQFEEAIKVHHLEYLECRPMNICESQGTIELSQATLGLNQGGQAFAGDGFELSKSMMISCFFASISFCTDPSSATEACESSRPATCKTAGTSTFEVEEDVIVIIAHRWGPDGVKRTKKVFIPTPRFIRVLNLCNPFFDISVTAEGRLVRLYGQDAIHSGLNGRHWLSLPSAVSITSRFSRS